MGYNENNIILVSQSQMWSRSVTVYLCETKCWLSVTYILMNVRAYASLSQCSLWIIYICIAKTTIISWSSYRMVCLKKHAIGNTIVLYGSQRNKPSLHMILYVREAMARLWLGHGWHWSWTQFKHNIRASVVFRFYIRPYLDDIWSAPTFVSWNWEKSVFQIA